MNKKRIRIIVCLATIFLTACVPSPQAIQTAIAQTQAANPTSTFTPVPSSTETPTETPSATSTITIMPSQTPDLLLLQLNLKDFLLQKSDLPQDAKYYMINKYSIRLVPNEDVHKGTTYLVETGRIDGWVAYYKKGSNNILAPVEIYIELSFFKTTEGARLSITEYSDDITNVLGYTEEINPPEIGDLTRSFYYTSDASGRYEVGYLITFSYKNIVHLVQA